MWHQTSSISCSVKSLAPWRCGFAPPLQHAHARQSYPDGVARKRSKSAAGLSLPQPVRVSIHCTCLLLIHACLAASQTAPSVTTGSQHVWMTISPSPQVSAFHQHNHHQDSIACVAKIVIFVSRPSWNDCSTRCRLRAKARRPLVVEDS